VRPPVVLVVEGDKILLDRGYGSANLEWSIPNAPDVEFRIGSLTKQFTATLERYCRLK
jgi:CubicO group peptidase (beta-lactamase class C family)